MTTPLIKFPASRPYTNIQPFTVRDGATYLMVLESLREWLRDTLVPHVDREHAELVESWNSSIETLTQQLLEDSVDLQDPVMTGIIADPESQFRAEFDNLLTDFQTNLGTLFPAKSDVYTKVEADGRYTPAGEAYSKAASDARYPATDAVFTKSESDGRYPAKADVYTKAASDTLLSGKADVADLFDYWTIEDAQDAIDAVSLVGTLAARPAANTVRPGVQYTPTDVPEVYVSTGTSWIVVGQSGQELGYASSIALFSTTAQADISGMTTTFVVGQRPIEISAHVRLASAFVGEVARVHIMLDTVEVQRIENGASPYADSWESKFGRVRVQGLTPGSTHTVKLRLSSNGGGNARIGGDPTLPNNLLVTTL